MTVVKVALMSLVFVLKAAAGYQIYLRAYYYGVYRAYREHKEGLHG